MPTQRPPHLKLIKFIRILDNKIAVQKPARDTSLPGF